MFKGSFVLLFTFIVCALAWGSPGGEGQGQGFGGRRQGRGQVSGYQNGGDRQYGYNENSGSGGRNGRQNGGPGGRYVANFYNDKEVYGYDARYPFGEAAYINYRSKDARARRGQEFARTSRAYSRNGGAGGQGGQEGYGGHGGYGSQNGYGSQGGHGQEYGGGNW